MMTKAEICRQLRSMVDDLEHLPDEHFAMGFVTTRRTFIDTAHPEKSYRLVVGSEEVPD